MTVAFNSSGGFLINKKTKVHFRNEQSAADEFEVQCFWYVYTFLSKQNKQHNDSRGPACAVKTLDLLSAWVFVDIGAD